MRFPYGSGNWYNAQSYGKKTDYGYHEGDDFNLVSGGDSDLGQPLYAIADGTVTSVHTHITKPTFGTHIHIQHDGKWGTVYSHYAHLQSTSVKVGDRVTEGQQVGRLGKSGTDAAHLHFAIKNQPTGVDGIARTLADLAKWENPTEFINKWKGTMSDEYGDLVYKATQHDETVKYIYTDKDPRQTPSTEIQQHIAGLKSRATDLQNQLVKAEAEVVNRTEQVGRLKDEITRIEAIKKDLLIKISSTEKIVNDYEGTIGVLKAQVDALAKEKGSLKTQIAVLEAENSQLKRGVQTSISLWEWITYPIPFFIKKLKEIRV